MFDLGFLLRLFLPKRLNQANTFFRSRLSRYAKLKAHLDLVLAIFGWKNLQIYVRTFSGIHQTFLVLYITQTTTSFFIVHNAHQPFS